VRRELVLRAKHAFGHSYEGARHPGTHHPLNIDGFLRELEMFIDAKIEEARSKDKYR
jgi:hypothetical protein